MTTVKTALDAAPSERIRYPRSPLVPETDVYRAIERLARDAKGAGPFSGQLIVTDATTTISRWICGLVWDETEDRFFLIELLGTGHDIQNGMLVVRETHDGFDTLRRQRTIFSRESDPRIRAGAFAAMANGRIGGLVTTGTAPNYKTWFVYTDDLFTTLTVTEITADVGSQFVYGQLMSWPVSSGGDDDEGFVVFTYSGASTTIQSIRTAN